MCTSLQCYPKHNLCKAIFYYNQGNTTFEIKMCNALITQVFPVKCWCKKAQKNKGNYNDDNDHDEMMTKSQIEVSRRQDTKEDV